MTQQATEYPPRDPTGIAGFDFILGGGYPRNEMIAIQGGAGTGKTTVGLQFLLEGRARGERSLYVTLAQSQARLEMIARSHSWSMETIRIHEMQSMDLLEHAQQQQTVFPAAYVELAEVMEGIYNAVRTVQPQRVVIDAAAQVRLLAGTQLRYRQELLTLSHCFDRYPATVLLLDDLPVEQNMDLFGLISGVICLEQVTPLYGSVRRRLEVIKLRGVPFMTGYHDFRIHTGGIELFARLEANIAGASGRRHVLKSNNAALDALVGGGLESGTACVIVGPAGTGKSSLATTYVHAALRQGQRVAIFLFDERPETFYERAADLGMDLRPFDDQLLLHTVDPWSVSTNEFGHMVRSAVEVDGVETVVIDSLTGYYNSVPQEPLLATQMHEMVTYLGRRGVLTLLVVAQHGLAGPGVQAPVRVMYLADTILLLRHFEVNGRVRQAVAVVKKRRGAHEKNIRELDFGAGGVVVGEPFDEFAGILSGDLTILGKPRTRWI